MRLFGKRKLLRSWVLNIQNPDLLAKAFLLYTFFNKSWKINVKPNGNRILVRDQNGLELQILHGKRLTFYKRGIKPRIDRLFHDYMINLVDFDDGDVVIDCGANIGEIGKGLSYSGKTLKYVAFEPGEAEIEACRTNNPNSVCENKALWNSNKILRFYEKSDTADSSVIEIPDYDNVTEIEAVTLDSYCSKADITAIKLLKIEAEGAEPEVLEGAKQVLLSTQYICVDCGFERGISQESTLPAVVNFLLSREFELVDVRKDRFTALFQRRRGPLPS